MRLRSVVTVGSMRYFSSRTSRGISGGPLSTVPAIAVVSCAALMLGACSGDDDPSPTAATAPETVTETVTATGGEPPEVPDASCADTPVDNPLTGQPPIPVRFADSGNSGSEGISFHYTVMDGGPDPCTPLTWVTLAGTNGKGGPGATAGSTRQTVALLADGRLVTDPAPILARRIDAVEQVDDSTVRVDYAFFTDAPAVLNETDPGSATFHYDGTSVSVTENSLPLRQNDHSETLDLDAVPVS